MIDQRFKGIWEKLMIFLDENKVSKTEAILLSDMLYAISSSENKVPSSEIDGYKPLFREDYGFENIPYLKSRWGLDRSLLKDDN